MIKFGEHTYSPADNESILDCLLRHGVAIPYSCRNGVCQTCLMRAVDGIPTVASQKGLKQSQASQNYFLACACYPEKDMEIVRPDAQANRHTTTVVEKAFLSDSIVRLRLARPDNFPYYAGQFLTLFKSDTVGRSYSLASVPDIHDYLEFHIRIIPEGEVSPWLANKLEIGSEITISDPLGNCIYIGNAKTQPLLLIGTGTGMAPLLGIVEQAIHNDHQYPINIYHGVRFNSDLYLDEHFKSLVKQNNNVNYYPCISDEEPQANARKGFPSDLVLEDSYDLKDYAVYLCGNPDMVNNAKRQIFLAGASLQSIHADPFVFK